MRKFTPLRMEAVEVNGKILISTNAYEVVKQLEEEVLAADLHFNETVSTLEDRIEYLEKEIENLNWHLKFFK